MWTLAGFRIVVQDKEGSVKQIIPRLQPLAGGTVHQIFGYETEITKLVGVVVGEATISGLKNLTTTGIEYPLVGWDIPYGDYLVSSVAEKRSEAIYQTIDYNQDCDAPVFTVEIELYKV